MTSWGWSWTGVAPSLSEAATMSPKMDVSSTMLWLLEATWRRMGGGADLPYLLALPLDVIHNFANI